MYHPEFNLCGIFPLKTNFNHFQLNRNLNKVSENNSVRQNFFKLGFWSQYTSPNNQYNVSSK